MKEETEAECAERMRRIREDFKSSYEMKKAKPRKIVPISSPADEEYERYHSFPLGDAMMDFSGKAEMFHRMYGGEPSWVRRTPIELSGKDAIRKKYQEASEYSGMLIKELANRIDRLAAEMGVGEDFPVILPLLSEQITFKQDDSFHEGPPKSVVLNSTKIEARFILVESSFHEIDLSGLEIRVMSALRSKKDLVESMVHESKYKSPHGVWFDGVWVDEVHHIKPLHKKDIMKDPRVRGPAILTAKDLQTFKPKIRDKPPKRHAKNHVHLLLDDPKGYKGK